MNLADTGEGGGGGGGGSTPRSEWAAPPSWWVGTDPGGGQGGGGANHHQEEEEQKEMLLQGSDRGHRQRASTLVSFEPDESRLRAPPERQRGVAGRDPRSMFGDLPNSSFDTDLLGDPVRRELDHQRALPYAERPSAAATRASEDPPPPQRAGLGGNNDQFWRRECSRLQEQLEALTKERDRWEQDRRRLVSDDVDRARDLVGLKRAVEAQSQLVMESLVAAQRLATVGSSEISEREVPHQGLPYDNARGHSSAHRHGPISTPPLAPDDDPKAFGGPLPLKTFAQRQQTYADRRPEMDIVARYSRGGASRCRYPESRQQGTGQAGVTTRQAQSGAAGGGGNELPRNFFSRSPETGHMPLTADPARRKLRRMYDYDRRGRSSGWRRIVDGDGGSGNSSGSGGNGRRTVWEWNGRRVVLHVFPTATTPSTLETPTPAAEPDRETKGQSTTEIPQAAPAASVAATTATEAAAIPTTTATTATPAAAAAEAAAVAAAEATAQILSTSLLNEVDKVKAALRDLAGAVGPRDPPPPGGGGDAETAPLTPDEPPTATPSATSPSHQPRPPGGVEHERSRQTPLELDVSLSRRPSSSTPAVHPVSSSNSAPENEVTDSDDAKSTANLRAQSLSLSLGGEMNHGAGNADGVSLLFDEKSSGNNAAGGGQEIGAGASGAASPRCGSRPSIEEDEGEEEEEEGADDETSGARENIALRSSRSTDREREPFEENSGSLSLNAGRSSSSSPPLAQPPENSEPARTRTE